MPSNSSWTRNRVHRDNSATLPFISPNTAEFQTPQRKPTTRRCGITCCRLRSAQWYGRRPVVGYTLFFRQLSGSFRVRCPLGKHRRDLHSQSCPLAGCKISKANDRPRITAAATNTHGPDRHRRNRPHSRAFHGASCLVSVWPPCGFAAARKSNAIRFAIRFCGRYEVDPVDRRADRIQ